MTNWYAPALTVRVVLRTACPSRAMIGAGSSSCTPPTYRRDPTPRWSPAGAGLERHRSPRGRPSDGVRAAPEELGHRGHQGGRDLAGVDRQPPALARAQE